MIFLFLDDLDNYYLDKDCVPHELKNVKEHQICGDITIGVRISPISLDFSNGAKETWKAVKFKLHPEQQGEYVTWKASGLRPLLVYDLKHTGIIQDGRQLFGNWAFGGKSKINVALDTNSNTYWKNGYEALAELDLDRDGYLRGNELKDLALWYDHNQNAISESGEVKKITETEVVAINVNYDSFDPKTGEYSSSTGYESFNGSSFYSGTSIDWYTGSYQRVSDVAAELSLYSSQQEPYQSEPVETEKTDNSIDNLSGVWYWEAEGDSKSVGLLGLTDLGNGSIIGNSVIENGLLENNDGYQSYLKRFEIKDGRKSLADGKIQLDFRIYDSVSFTESSAIYDPETKRLTGNTTQSQGEQTFTYNWVARRER